MKVKAPTEKNFRRAKVKPGKRKTVRAWFSWRVLRIPLVILLVLYAGHRATSLVLNASALKVTRIVVPAPALLMASTSPPSSRA